MTPRELQWKADGRIVTVRIEGSKSHGNLHVSGATVPFRLLGPDRVEINARLHRFYVFRNGDSFWVWLDGRTYRLERIERGMRLQSAMAAPTGAIIANMPGKLLRLEVAVGDTVAVNQTVAIMESMKMETSIHAPQAGQVKEIRCQPGQIVEMGELLMVIQ